MLVVLSQGAGASGEKLRARGSGGQGKIRTARAATERSATFGSRRKTSRTRSRLTDAHSNSAPIRASSRAAWPWRLRLSLARIDPNDRKKMKEAYALLAEAMRLAPPKSSTTESRGALLLRLRLRQRHQSPQTGRTPAPRPRAHLLQPRPQLPPEGANRRSDTRLPSLRRTRRTGRSGTHRAREEDH